MPVLGFKNEVPNEQIPRRLEEIQSDQKYSDQKYLRALLEGARASHSSSEEGQTPEESDTDNKSGQYGARRRFNHSWEGVPRQEADPGENYKPA